MQMVIRGDFVFERTTVFMRMCLFVVRRHIALCFVAQTFALFTVDTVFDVPTTSDSPNFGTTKEALKIHETKERKPSEDLFHSPSIPDEKCTASGDSGSMFGDRDLLKAADELFSGDDTVNGAMFSLLSVDDDAIPVETSPTTNTLFSANKEIDDDESAGNSHLRTSNAVIPEHFELPQINYASSECLAKVLYANAEAVNKDAVLRDKDNDFYLRNPCERAQNKFLIIELCEYVRPTALDFANFEFFSSSPKNVRVSVSELYPTFEWIVVAEFAAEDTREVQRFPITSPNVYVKFLKVEFLSHYGSEYYCTLSFLRVFGTTKEESISSSISPFGGDDLTSVRLPPNLHHLLDCFQCSPTSKCQNTRNYAAKECGANVLFANPEAFNKEGVLTDRDLDYYLRNPCENLEKFLIVRLCEGVQPTRIEIANFEYFSSGPRKMRLSVSKVYPTNEWTVVSEFEAQDTREVQCFPILPTGSYVRYVKLELLSHYGSEYYCTLSFLRVYGISKVDEFEEDVSNHSRKANYNSQLEDEVYMLKWFVGLLLSFFVIFTLNYFL